MQTVEVSPEAKTLWISTPCWLSEMAGPDGLIAVADLWICKNSMLEFKCFMPRKTTNFFLCIWKLLSDMFLPLFCCLKHLPEFILYQACRSRLIKRLVDGIKNGMVQIRRGQCLLWMVVVDTKEFDACAGRKILLPVRRPISSSSRDLQIQLCCSYTCR